MGPGANVSGNVSIGSQCWIGAGAVINQGTPRQMMKIGDDTQIGSGSVVTKIVKAPICRVPAGSCRETLIIAEVGVNHNGDLVLHGA